MNAASPKQVAFIERLAVERGVEVDMEAITDSRMASSTIEGLLLLPRKAAAGATAEALTPGMYKSGEDIFKVQKTRDGERLYAKRLVQIGGRRLVDATEEVVDFEFEYAPGAMRSLTLADRLPVEEAKALGLRYGRCIVCGRHLKDAYSVQNGIGPVCIKRFNW